MNTLNVLARLPRTAADYIRTCFIFVVGVATTLLASMVNTPQGVEFAQSALILPCVAGSYWLGESLLSFDRIWLTGDCSSWVGVLAVDEVVDLDGSGIRAGVGNAMRELRFYTLVSWCPLDGMGLG